MGKAEEIHELIYTNLSLLKAGGHRIDFKQNMFKEHNLPGFEAVGYALLMIIDPTECKSKIPWPLVNDKAQAREFRTNFTKFIKMINTKYKGAKIPEVNASTLQFPGGMRFLDFIYKLSTFALELELKKTLTSEERENMLPRPLMCKAKDQKVKLMMVRGAVLNEQESLLRFKQYEADGPVVLKKMNVCLNDITTNCKAASEQLKLEVSSLHFDDKTKASLLDIEDSTVIKEYNERTEKKYEEIENNSRKLRQLHDLADQCCQLGKMAQPTQEETQCLDGHKLGFNRFLNELAGGPVVNAEGDVKLLEVMRAAHTAATRLTRSPGSPSLLLPAQDLQVRCSSLATKSYKAESALKRLSQENRQAVDTLRPLVYSTLKNKKIPEVFKHLKERPALNFVLPQSVAKADPEVKPGKKRKSFGTVLRRKNTVVCSFKTKREPKKHVSSTPIFKTPACRKSLYSMLPTGTRHKRTEEVKPVEVTPDTPTLLTPAVSAIRETLTSEACLSSRRLTIDTASPRPSTAPRCGRKSLNDIIQRFQKLKQSMNTSLNSKNESDTCNESET